MPIKTICKGTHPHHRLCLLEVVDLLNAQTSKDALIVVGTKNVFIYFFKILRARSKCIIYFTGFGRIYTDYHLIGKFSFFWFLKLLNLIQVRKYIVENDDDLEFIKKISKSNDVVRVSGSGFNLSKFQKNRNSRKQFNVFGYLARFGRSKHTKKIYNLACKLPTDIDIVIAGIDINGNKYSRLFEELSLRKHNVKFLGFLSTVDEISDFFNQVDLLLFPTRREGLPITLLESVFHGVPYIASNVSGVTFINKYFEFPLITYQDDFEDIEIIFNLANSIEFPSEQKLQKIFQEFENKNVRSQFEAALMKFI